MEKVKEINMDKIISLISINDYIFYNKSSDVAVYY